MIVHVDAERLAGGGEADGVCQLADGPAIAAATARRIACDAARLGVLEGADGEPLSVGRRTRAIAPALRRALELRDGGCRFPAASSVATPTATTSSPGRRAARRSSRT